MGPVRVNDAEFSADTDLRVGATTVSVHFGAAPCFLELAMEDHLGPLVGASTAMRRVYALIKRVAPAETTVLIQGQTGTGKELVAATLHDGSPRAEGPFIAVDCGSIAAGVIESELFGHVKGAFSGAATDRIGVLEAAAGGTVFFDEIGELPLSLQPKLLRVLEKREVRPVGGNTARSIDVRIVAATNRPLGPAVNQGAFREDLYYRLAVIEIALPPLSDRRDDIAPLVQHFYQRFTSGEGDAPDGLVAELSARSWPGNVRELRNAIERAVLLGWSSSTGSAEPEKSAAEGAFTVQAQVMPGWPLKQARAAWGEQFDSIYLRALLDKTDGNVTRAAELAGISRRSLQRLMIRRGLRATNEDE